VLTKTQKIIEDFDQQTKNVGSNILKCYWPRFI
jgi:hypothetical protein